MNASDGKVKERDLTFCLWFCKHMEKIQICTNFHKISFSKLSCVTPSKQSCLYAFHNYVSEGSKSERVIKDAMALTWLIRFIFADNPLPDISLSALLLICFSQSGINGGKKWK